MAAVESHHWWYSGMRAIAAAWLDQALPGSPRHRMLDAGCGTGGNVEFLARYGQVVGIDLMALATQYATQRVPSQVARASVVALPFGDESFDLVTSFEVLYHRAVLDVSQALAETLRVLRPDGYLLVRLPAYGWLMSQHDRSVHTRERYTATQATALLQDANFVVERVSYCNSLLFPLALIERWVERFRPVAEVDSAMTMPDRLLNTPLRLALELEAALFAHGVHFPWGLSVLALARKGVTSGED